VPILRVVSRAVICVLAGAFAALGLGGPVAAGTKAAEPAAVFPSLARPCGTLSGKPVVDKVLLIWEENHNYSSIIGNPGAPLLNNLAAKCGLATRYQSLTHPSLPNYMEMTSGLAFSSWPWVSDCDPQGSCTTSAASIFSALGAAGQHWRSYVEAMGGNCGLVSYGEYAAKHNPAVYYTSLRHECDAWDQPMGTLSGGPLHLALVSGPSAALTTLTPDLLDDMHDGTVAEADGWLAGWWPQVVASPAYRSGQLAVMIVWDEGAGSGNAPSHVPLIVMSGSTPTGARSALPFDGFSVLRTICQLTGVASLGRAASAATLVGPFHL
jgi:phosphatidylinositol-3-phosphatase